MRAQSANQDQLAIYGALWRIDGALTPMIGNRTNAAITSPAGLSSFTPASRAQIYRYNGANLTAIVR